MNNRIVGMALGVVAMTCASAFAGGPVSYAYDMDGSQVVGGGDVDGAAVGTMTFDAGSQLISWSITYTNLNAVTGIGIYPGGVGQTGAIFISMGGPGATGPEGDGMLVGSAGFSAALINGALGAGENAYVQILTSGFANGAVRDQLGTEVPAPGALCVMGLAGIAATRRKR